MENLVPWKGSDVKLEDSYTIKATVDYLFEYTMYV